MTEAKRGDAVSKSAPVSAGGHAIAAAWLIDLLDAAADEAALAKALQAEGLSGLTAPLLPALACSRAKVREFACHALRMRGKLGDVELASLGVVVRDEDPLVRAAAVRAAAAAERPQSVGAILLRGLCDRDSTVSLASAAALVGGAAAALPGVIVGLGSIDEPTLQHVVVGLRRIPAAPAALAAALSHGDERVRMRALQAICDIGDGALLQCEAAVRLLQSDDSREVAASARRATTRLLRIGGPQVREEIPLPAPDFASGALDPKAAERASKAGMATLRALANDGRVGVQRNAWRAIAAAGRLDYESTLLATVALKDSDADVRALAAAALEQPAPTAMAQATAALVLARRDGHHAVKVAVQRAIDQNAEGMVAHLEPLLDARIDTVADAVVDTLAQLGFAKCGALLRAGLSLPGPIQRELAARALARLGAEAVQKCWKELLPLLSDPYDPTRAAALQALSLQGAKVRADAALLERIRGMYNDDGSWIVRAAADRALRRIGT